MGYNSEEINFREVVVAIADLSGDLPWAFKFGSYAQDEGYSVAETSNGFVIDRVHNSGRDGFVLMLMEKGGVTFQASIPDSELR